MNEIAFFLENSSISYVALFVSLGTLAALACAAITAVLNDRQVGPVMLGAAISVLLCIPVSRLVYWYCNPEQYDGPMSALTDTGSGGFSLAGVFIGVALSALIIRLIGLTDNYLALMDCYAPGAALGIALGRLGGFFTNDDKGNFLFTDEEYFGLPYSVAITDSVTGSTEWRFASFFWESMAGFVIFAVLLLIMFLKPVNRGSGRHGMLFMTFISLFGATQAALESTRYDALHMRSNGFISLMQLVSLILLLLPMVYYSVKLIRAHRQSLKTCLIFWGTGLAMLGAAGVCEYLIQRKANMAMSLHPLQLIALLIFSLMTMLVASRMYRITDPEGRFCFPWLSGEK